MQFFILFIVGAVILGSGAMLSPAWPTREPRIGLAATFFLALIVGGAVWWAELFGWSTLVIDYLLFALVSFVVLGGTLSSAQARAEAQGDAVLDSDQGWPGPEDLAFFTVAALLCFAPLLVMSLPAGEAAQATGLLALTARDGGSFTQLAPYYSEITVLTAPGFQALTAYLSQQLGQPTPFVQWSVAAIAVLLCVWMAYDLGGEIRSKRLGRAMALGTITALGVAGLFVNGFYPQLFGVLFGMGYLLCLLRLSNEGAWLDSIASGLLLGAVLYVSPSLFVVLALSTLLWLLLGLFGRRQPDKTPFVVWSWLWMVGALAFGVVPWLFNNTEWLRYTNPSPLTPDLANLSLLLTHFGFWLAPAALLGGVLAWRSGERIAQQVVMWCSLVLLISVDIGVVGVLPSVLPNMRHLIDPALVLWMGATIPLTVLASFALLWIYEQLPGALRMMTRRYAYGLMLGAALLIVAVALLAPQPLTDRIEQAVSASAQDVAAMRWVAENAPDDSLILNHPATGLWAAAFTERRVVHLPALQLLGDVNEPAAALFGFWEEPQEAVLRDAGVTHILLPSGGATPWATMPDYLVPVEDEGQVVPSLYRLRP